MAVGAPSLWQSELLGFFSSPTVSVCGTDWECLRNVSVPNILCPPLRHMRRQSTRHLRRNTYRMPRPRPKRERLINPQPISSRAIDDQITKEIIRQALGDYTVVDGPAVLSHTGPCGVSNAMQTLVAFIGLDCEGINPYSSFGYLSPTSVRELLLPAIQNMLKDPDALDPAHKEALEVIIRERSGGTLEVISKVMGSHLNMTSMSNLFGESGLLGKKEPGDISDPAGHQLSQPEDNRFRRIMRGNFSEMIRGKGKSAEENIYQPPS
eukprot:Gb_24366 [translate_table: standard]